MSKSKAKKQAQEWRKKEQHGYAGYLKLKEVYPFMLYFQACHGYKLGHTEGNELAVLIKNGKTVRVWFDEELRQVCTDRHGMALSYTWRTFGAQGGYFRDWPQRLWGVNDIW